VRKSDDLTTFIVPKVEKIWSLNLPDPQGPAQACSGKPLPFTWDLRTGFITFENINKINIFTISYQLSFPTTEIVLYHDVNI
jgi:hypothetical protein